MPDRVLAACFGISLLVNAAAFVSFDKTFSLNTREIEKQVARRNNGGIQFQFVEAPPKIHPQKPAETRKIAARDALNQDLLKDKSRASGAPHVKTRGPADQLAQSRSTGASGRRQEPQKTKNPSPSAADSPDFLKKKDASSEKPAPSPAPGAMGRDKIDTRETGRARSRGARLYGLTSFEAIGSDMGGYMKNLKEKIWLAWFPYLAFQYPQDFKGADAVISFTLNPKGEVMIVKVVESRGSGAFAAYCMEAVQRAGNFGEVPKEILALTGKNELEIRFAFHYY
ncbi:MAG: TonB C-terminal domain-containing protein [Candidatus Omnitrophica bacterium]|nr:TonB C-terminal domain-containing protein [Candidatus Omnitrophota bacterium]